LTTGLTDGALLWQVACEFVAASRKLAPFGFSHAQSYGKLISEDDESEVRSDVNILSVRSDCPISLMMEPKSGCQSSSLSTSPAR